MKFDIPLRLSAFLDIAGDTSIRVSANAGPALRLIEEVDDLIREKLWGTDVGLAPVPATVAMNSYYSFLAAVRIVISGQVAAIFPLIRHSLECACYAYRMAEDPKVVNMWLNRHHGEQEQKACRRTFTSAVADVSRSVAARQEQLGSLVNDLYQWSIDLGAHPNQKSIVSHLSLDNSDDSTVRVDFTCLYGAEDLRIQQGLLACAEDGIASAFVIALAAKDHPLIDAEYTALAAVYRRVQETVAELQK